MTDGRPVGDRPAPAVALAGRPGPRMETVLEGLCARLAAQGLRVAVWRCAPGGCLGDEGKDIGRFRQAGARITVLAAPGLLQMAWSAAPGPDLTALWARTGPEADLILVEGLPAASLPWIGVASPEREAWEGETAGCLALVAEQAGGAAPPVFACGEMEALAAYIRHRLGV